MKRIISLIISALILVNAVFAGNFFANRFFEVKVDVPVGISNNVFAAGDFLKKDLVIDLEKIADSIPAPGLTAIVATNPEVSVNFNIAAVSFGVNAGVDIYSKLNVSKDLFNFLFKGYHAGEELVVELADPVLDTYVYAEVPFALRLKKFSLNVTPGVFYPIAILDNCNIKATASNNQNGDIHANLDADINLYTSSFFAPMIDSSYAGPKTDINGLIKNLGFDLTANVTVPFTKRLSLSVDGRFPLVPAKLDANLNVKAKYDVSGNIMDLAGGGSVKQTPMETTMTTSPLNDLYKVNRPLKLNAYFNYKPFGFLRFKAGGGFGIRRVGSENPLAYPEYYADCTVSLFEMLRATLSTEYTDLLFKHQLEAVVNLRLVDLDAGVSFQASNFLSSFKLAGLGAHVGVIIGF